MNPIPPEISVTAPVTLAIERVKEVLFRPFDFGKWIAIGFCAWLASLGSGYHSNGHLPGGKSSTTASAANLAHVHDYLVNNLFWIIPVALTLVVIFLAVWAALLWVQSRGIFMLLHCVALNRGEVVVPWRKFAAAAHSLWLFRLCLAAVIIALSLPFIGIMGWIVFDLFTQRQHVAPMEILALLGIAIVWFCICLPFAVISAFTRNFAVPLMVLNGGTCVEAWRILRRLLAANPGGFVLYVLFQVVIGIAVGFIVLAFILCTLLIGGVLLAIPFVGTVIYLPVTVFYRSYSLYYLAQYGPEFDVFRPAPSSPPPLPPLAS